MLRQRFIQVQQHEAQPGPRRVLGYVELLVARSFTGGCDQLCRIAIRPVTRCAGA